MAVKVTYFDIEGVAEPVRLALTLAGKEFEDSRVKMDEWAKIKPTTKFGQLPLMTVDGTEIAQSGAMLRFIGKNYGGGKLYPTDGLDLLKVEEAIGLVEDFNKTWAPCLYIGMRPQAFGYPEGFAQTDEGKAKTKALRTGYIAESLPTFLKFFAKMIEENGGFLVGGKVTIADCLLLPSLRKFQKGHIDHVPTTCLDSSPAITDYIKRVMALPEVAAWYAKH